MTGLLGEVDLPARVGDRSASGPSWLGGAEKLVGRPEIEQREPAGFQVSGRPPFLFPDGTAAEFGDDIQVTEVPGVLLEEVEQNPLESGGFGAVPAGAWSTDTG